MRTIFSTKVLHPRDRFDYWHSVACDKIVAHDSVPTSRSTFQAELRVGALSDIPIVWFQNSSMSVSHTERHIAQSGADEVLICRQIAGTLALEQNGRSCLLEPADFTVIDPKVPYSGRFASSSELLLLKVPRRSMESRLGSLQDHSFVAMKPARAENALTSSILAMLPDYADGLESVAELVREQVLDLIAASMGCSDRSVADTSVGPMNALVMAKLCGVINARLSDPNLHPLSVAEAAGVSLRHAEAVLAARGTCIRDLILEQRVLKCGRSLQDSAESRRSIRDIAWEHGFRDSARFRKAFAATYAMSPEEFRRTHVAPGSAPVSRDVQDSPAPLG